MVRRKPKTGDRRIDAAIDHFVPMGFKKTDVRNIVNSLLKNVYGNDGWLFLEENCYHVVQEALLEKQEEEEKLQILQKQQQQQEEQQQQQDEEEGAQHVQEQQEEDWEEDDEAQPVQQQQQEEEEEEEWEWEDDDEAQQHDAAMVEPVVQVHKEEPSETLLAVEQAEAVFPMIIDPPAPKAALPHLPATRSGRARRRPCFGWISESESDSDYEEFLSSRQQVVPVPSGGGDLGKRKRPSRWDVKKEAA